MSGKYVLTVELGNAEVTRSFEVKPGSESSQNIYLTVGKARLRALPSPGGEPISAHWHVYRRNPDGSRGAHVGTEDYRSEPQFILAQGDYVVHVEIDGGREAEHKFSVKAGAESSEQIVVGK